MQPDLNVDTTAPMPDAFKRLAVLGPRYTSYPTADRFLPTFNSGDFAKAVTNAFSKPDQRASIYIHIPFCRHACFYCACNKLTTQSVTAPAEYIKRLLAEIDALAKTTPYPPLITQIHFGGGTPTLLANEQIESILNRLSQHFKLQKSTPHDWAIEIDPRTVTPGRMQELAQIGFNRVSFGIQDTNPIVQAAINRIQPESLITNTLNAARDAGFLSIGFDLIYGLPFQTEETFKETLSCVLSHAPDQVAFFNYAHLPSRFSAQKRINEAALPNAEERFKIVERITATMTNAGYIAIGLDHFAKKGSILAEAYEEAALSPDSSPEINAPFSTKGTLYRSFQGYSPYPADALIGIGASAISEAGGCYAQNTPHLDAYLNSETQFATIRGVKLSTDDIIRKDVIQQIMCRGTVNIKATETRHNINFNDYFAEELAPNGKLHELEEMGVITRNSKIIQVTPKHRLFLRHAAMVFDKYLRTQPKKGNYSNTI